MKYGFVSLLCLLFGFYTGTGMARMPDGGGALPTPGDHANRKFYDQALQRAHEKALELKAAQGPKAQVSVPSPAFQWPMRKSIQVTAPGINGISNYVDQDSASDSILDYNCGTRTYDGHTGTDIFLTPFPWLKMEQDQGIVVAAADGTIVDKVGDQPERSCSKANPSGENNLIILEHNDGSMSLYAHMRTNSLTAKEIGDTVRAGDYLGVVGSAGYSTGPHLHFEVGVWTLDGDAYVWTPRDPYMGECNSLNMESWWASQPDYYQSRINLLATHDAPPEIPDCPTTETPHFQDSFTAAQTMYVAAYYRDQLKGQVSKFRIEMPDGATYAEWDDADSAPGRPDHFAASYWYYQINLPENAKPGEWKWIVEYEGQTLEHSFWVDAAPEPPPDIPVVNNDVNGLWYDADLEGEGFNVITGEGGTIVFYYGSSATGQRLWLISDLLVGPITIGQDQEIVMYESTGGSFDMPVASARGLSKWGTLTMNFDDCDSGTVMLSGVDGDKTSHLTKLAAVPGTGCGGDQTAEGELSGLFFDPALDGEGFNLVVSGAGAVIFYYGFDSQGNRLWLIAGPIPSELVAGQSYDVDLYKADSGTYSAPTPSDQALVKWGSLNLEVKQCNLMTYTMDTPDGMKVSHSLRLASVVGVSCN